MKKRTVKVKPVKDDVVGRRQGKSTMNYVKRARPLLKRYLADKELAEWLLTIDKVIELCDNPEDAQMSLVERHSSIQAALALVIKYLKDCELVEPGAAACQIRLLKNDIDTAIKGKRMFGFR